MKKTFLLLGIVAMALGNMTSCSNILEEEGTIPASAKTGTLTVALEADNSVNVTTKADENTYTIPSSLYNVENFTVKVTKEDNGTSTTVESLSGTYSSIKDKSETVAAGFYKLVAYNKEESAVKDFEWDAPYFSGTGTTTLKKNATATLSAECKLQNSIIGIDFGDLLATDDDIEVVSLTAKADNVTDFEIYKDGAVVDNMDLSTKMVYAKAGIGAKLVLVVKSTKLNKEKTIETEIKGADETTNSAEKKYSVQYSFVEDGDGVLSIQISVNVNITVVTNPVSVDPYEDNTTN